MGNSNMAEKHLTHVFVLDFLVWPQSGQLGLVDQTTENCPQQRDSKGDVLLRTTFIH